MSFAVEIGLRCKIGTVLCAAIATLFPEMPHAAVFVPLGDLPGGEFGSEAWAVSDDGSVVVGTSKPASAQEAFVWTPESGMVSLGGLPGELTRAAEAYGVSGDGTVIVGAAQSFDGNGIEHNEAFRWTAETGMVGLGYLEEGELSSVALGVSFDGGVVVGTSNVTDGSAREAFRWTPEDGMTGLGDLPGGPFESGASGVSADGAVIVGRGLSGGSSFNVQREAFRWTTATGLVGLGFLPNDRQSGAADVSADGSTIVGASYGDGIDEAFRWTAAIGMTGLGNLPGGGDFESSASAVSDDGNIVVGWGQNSDGNREAFIWVPTDGMQSLYEYLTAQGVTSHTQWRLDSANDISGDGLWIVGRGTNALGQQEAFLAYLSPTSDADSDGLLDSADNCQLVPNIDQTDTDADSAGDACDPDDDGDEIPDAWESANGLDPLYPGDAGTDLDADTLNNLDEYLAGTDPRNADTDADTFDDRVDNCPTRPNASQADFDTDGSGDDCDADDDDDGVPDQYDAYPLDPTRSVDVTTSQPMAVDDIVEVRSGSSILIDALANDQDLYDAPITVAIVAAPTNGSVVVQTTNEIVYTPNPGYFGGDSFSYAVSDADGDSSLASVFVSVSGFRPPPVVTPSGGAGTMSPLAVLLLAIVGVAFALRRKGSALSIALPGALSLICLRAEAQPSSDDVLEEDLETITVIGSHIEGIDPEGIAPTMILDRIAIELTGSQTVGEILEQLPMNNGGAFNDRDALSSSPGGTAISFRGLGPSAVLLLIDGRRMSTYGFPQSAEFGSIVSFVDANSIPLAAVERIEILKDGASALYGSEAHAAVINIVLRKDIAGTETEVRFGASDSSGADEKSVNVVTGWVEPRTSFRLIASHTDREQLAWRDRAISASADHEAQGGIDQRSLAATNFVVGGNIIRTLGADCAERNDSEATSAFVEVPTSGRFGICLYDPNAELVVPSATRTGLMALADRDIGERMNLHVEASYQIADAEGRRDPISLSGVTFPAANPWNRGPVDLLAQYRFSEIGPRIDRIETETKRAVVALQGAVSEWDWELGIVHHSAVSENAQRGYLNADRVDQALNGVDLNGNDQLEPDEYWNLYSPATNPNGFALTQSLAASTSRRAKTSLASFNVGFSGQIASLRSGAVRTAFGFEERRETLSDESDPLSLGSLLAATTIQRNWFGMAVGLPFDEIDPFAYVDPWEVQAGTVEPTGFPSTYGTRGSRSAFAEFLIPLLPKLNLQAALRLEDYGGQDVEIVPRAALRYDATSRIRMRASWGEGYRAPSLAELHAGPSTILQSSWDPRRCPEEGFLIPGLAGGCVVRSFVTAAWGNPNLSAELSETVTLSVEFQVFDKHAVGVDCWNTEIRDKILSAQTAWFIRNETELPEGFIIRDPPEVDDDTQFSPDPDYPGALAQINVLPLNFGRQEANGCDVELSSIWNRPDGDALEAQVIASHMASNELAFGAADPAEELAGTYGYPKNRVNLNLFWRTSSWRLGLAGRWTDGFMDTMPGMTVASHLEWDLQAAYSGLRRTEVTVGIENVFDEPPPFSVGTFHPQGFPVQFYDMRGRFFYAEVAAKFGSRRTSTAL